RVAELLMARDECVAVAPAFGRTVQGAADRVRKQRRGPDAVNVGEIHVVSSPNSIGPQKAKGPSLASLDEVAADDHPADFAGARADFIELGVTQEPSGRVFVDIAVAAQALDGVQRGAGGGLGGEEDGAGGI